MALSELFVDVLLVTCRIILIDVWSKAGTSIDPQYETLNNVAIEQVGAVFVALVWCRTENAQIVITAIDNCLPLKRHANTLSKHWDRHAPTPYWPIRSITQSNTGTGQ